MSDLEPTAWCEECHPGEVPDPLLHYTVRCTLHPEPPLPGVDDALITGPKYSPYLQAEVEGPQNRAYCNAIHRGAR